MSEQKVKWVSEGVGGWEGMSQWKSGWVSGSESGWMSGGVSKCVKVKGWMYALVVGK